MKDKFIRVLAPLTALIVIVLDLGVIGYGIYAIKKLITYPRPIVMIFAALDVIALIIAVLVTKEVITNGVKFYDDEFEFTGLDENNLFSYDDIVKIEYQKDEAPSFVKNFIDRASKIFLTLKEDKVVTIDLGLTTKNTLKAVCDEISARTDAPVEEIKVKKSAKKEEETEEKAEEE